MKTDDLAFAWLDAAKASADALNLLKMHPSLIAQEVLRRKNQIQLPPAIKFRPVREEDWLSIRLLVDNPAEAKSAFERRHDADRIRDAVVLADDEVAGYCGLDSIDSDRNRTAHYAFIIIDQHDHRRQYIETAIYDCLEAWLAELASDRVWLRQPADEIMAIRAAAHGYVAALPYDVGDTRMVDLSKNFKVVPRQTYVTQAHAQGNQITS